MSFELALEQSCVPEQVQVKSHWLVELTCLHAVHEAP